MLKVHALGHVYITRDAQAVPLSSKATALLTYLALEKHAYHREQLAGLLWDHPQALSNLRVELTRLKQQGIDAFPPRQPMLSLCCETDLDSLLREAGQLSERQLPQWLAQLRGAPLSGLEDLGSEDFRSWVDQRRTAINEQLESTLADLQQRYEQAGQPHLSAQVQERASRLGLRLPPAPPTAEQAGELHFSYPTQAQALRRILQNANQRPQLVFLNGMSGTKHALINDTVRGTQWHTIHLQGAPQRRLMQAALIQQLAQLQLRQSALTRPASELLQMTDDQEADLIHAMQFLSQSGLHVVLALHNLSCVEPWLVNGIRFALDLRMPLVIVLSSSACRVLSDMRQHMNQMDWGRQHEIHLPPIGAQGVIASQPPEAPPSTPPSELEGINARHHHAAVLAQQADGWPMHIRMLARPESELNLNVPQPRQAEALTQAILAELGPLPRPVMSGLQRLALLVDRFDPELARQVLGEQTDAVLCAALAAGVLLPVSAVEQVHFPSLESRTQDAEHHLAFQNEALRIALAKQLGSAERHSLRGQLAQHFMRDQPALAAYYAERAQLTELAAQARSQFQNIPNAEVHAPPAQLVGAPPYVPHPRQEVRTANGYRVALENGHLEIMRRGHCGPAPKLILHFAEMPAGQWRLTARLDVIGRELPGQVQANYALGLALDGTPRVIYATRPIPLPECPAHPCLGLIPTGRWFQVGGHAPGGALSLLLRANDIALTIGSFTWNNQVLIPPYRPNLT